MHNTVRLSVKILLVVGNDLVGDVSLKTDGSFGFCPNANWSGKNQ